MLIAIILFSIDLKQAMVVFLGIDWLLGSVLLAVVFPALVVLRSLRWHLIVLRYGIHQSFWRSIQLYLVAFSAGFVLSDGISSFVRSIFLYRDGYGASKSVLVAFWDKAIELVSLLFAGVVALTFLPQVVLENNTLLLPLLTVSLGLCALMILFGSSRAQAAILRRVIPIVARQVKRLEAVDLDALLLDLKNMTVPVIVGLIAYSCGIRVVYFAGIYALALALGLSVTYWQLALVMALAGLVLMLPITVAGLGTREAVLIPTLGLFGQSAEQAVALSLSLALVSTIWRALAALSWLVAYPRRRDLARAVFNDPLLPSG